MPRILADHNIERHFQVLVRLCSSSHWSEIRISKSETNSNFKGKSSKPGGLCVLVIPNFEFPIYLGFRASDFGFQLGDTRGRCIASLLARKGHEHLVLTVWAADAGEALGQIAALEKGRHGASAGFAGNLWGKVDRSTPKMGRNVSGAVDNLDHLDPMRSRQKENHITSDGKAAHALGQFRAGNSQVRLSHIDGRYVVNRIDQAIGDLHALRFVGNVVPNPV